jgi:dihydroorotate dehydrogenase
MTRTYDIARSYQFNYDRGPDFGGREPVAVDSGPMKRFLGLPVRSRLGIAAGLLLNSKWVIGYAARGYDLLTYKTVRSAYRPCYDPPNWVFVEEGEGGADDAVTVTEPDVGRTRDISSAVCFGMPSMAPEVWREDVSVAKAGLREGQKLIVSVVATPGDTPAPGEVADDFRQCAAWAVAAGADVVEANFSCPNVCSAEGTIYMDPQLSGRVAGDIKEAIGGVPLLIKVGQVKERAAMETLLRVLNGVAQGVTLVNGITRPVRHRDGRPAFGKAFLRAGVLGRAIHDPSVAQVRLASGIIARERMDLEIASVGGVATLEDMQDFFNAGAGAVLMGSSPMYLPDLAAQARRQHPEW